MNPNKFKLEEKSVWTTEDQTAWPTLVNYIWKKNWSIDLNLELYKKGGY